VLIGTIVTDSRALAYLQEPTLTGNGALRVPLGEKIGPYRLTKVLEDRVELEGPGGPLTVRLGGVASAGLRPPAGGRREPAAPAPVVAPPAQPGETEVIRFEVGDPRRREGFGAIFNYLQQQPGR
jgi:hypothetical protein